MVSPIGKSSSRLARIQQRARGSRAKPRDLAKPTEQHIAHPNSTRSQLQGVEESTGRDEGGQPKERKRGGKLQSSWGGKNEYK